MSIVKIKLDTVITELGISKNRVAVESKMRPNLILEMTNGKTQAIKLQTLATLLDTLNKFSKEQGLNEITVADILEYVPDE